MNRARRKTNQPPTETDQLLKRIITELDCVYLRPDNLLVLDGDLILTENEAALVNRIRQEGPPASPTSRSNSLTFAWPPNAVREEGRTDRT